MKKIILGSLILVLCSLQNTFAEDYYFGTKFCTEFETNLDNQFLQITYSENSKNYAWIKDGKIFVNGQKKYENIKNIYEIWGFVNSSETLVFSTRNDDKSETLYEGSKKIETFDSIESFKYNTKTNSWSLLVDINGKHYEVKDGVLSTQEYNFDPEIQLDYSRNGKYFGEIKKNGEKYYFQYNGKKTKLYNKIYSANISNDGKRYSFYAENTDGKNIQVIDGIESIPLTDRDGILGFSDDSKHIFYIKHNNLTGESFLYRNAEKIGKINNYSNWNNGFKVLVENGDEKYWIINGKNYKNFGKINWVKYSKNGDSIFVGLKDKKDSLFLNDKKILSYNFIFGAKISENGKDYLAVLDNNPFHEKMHNINPEKDYSDINNFRDAGTKTIFENGFYSKPYKYFLYYESVNPFSSSNDLQLYNFSTGYKDVFCRDITYMYPELQSQKEQIKKLLHKLKKLSKNQKQELISNLEKYLKNTNKNTKKYDLIHMLISNLK